MKKAILISIVVLSAILAGCDSEESSQGDENPILYAHKASVYKDSTLIFQSPCGIVKVQNPNTAKGSPGLMEGGAISTTPVITLEFTNAFARGCCYYGEKPSLYRVIKNFPILDQSVSVIVEGCEVVRSCRDCHG